MVGRRSPLALSLTSHFNHDTRVHTPSPTAHFTALPENDLVKPKLGILVGCLRATYFWPARETAPKGLGCCRNPGKSWLFSTSPQKCL